MRESERERGREGVGTDRQPMRQADRAGIDFDCDAFIAVIMMDTKCD